MESGEINQEVPTVQKLMIVNAWKPREAHGLWPWAPGASRQVSALVGLLDFIETLPALSESFYHELLCYFL